MWHKFIERRYEFIWIKDDEKEHWKFFHQSFMMAHPISLKCWWLNNNAMSLYGKKTNFLRHDGIFASIKFFISNQIYRFLLVSIICWVLNYSNQYWRPQNDFEGWHYFYYYTQYVYQIRQFCHLSWREEVSLFMFFSSFMFIPLNLMNKLILVASKTFHLWHSNL